jgi:hypothetical protein
MRLVGLLLATGVTARSGEAWSAEDERAEGVPAEPAQGEGLNILSVKLAWLQITTVGEAEDLRRIGVSLSYERVLIPGWLEGEVSVLFAPGTGGLTLPVDLLLKKPFELSRRIELFAGLGLASEWFEAGERETAYGLGTQVGGQYWLEPEWAIGLEAEYNLLLHPETAHEVVVAAGLAFRF